EVEWAAALWPWYSHRVPGLFMHRHRNRAGNQNKTSGKAAVKRNPANARWRGKGGPLRLKMASAQPSYLGRAKRLDGSEDLPGLAPIHSVPGAWSITNGEVSFSEPARKGTFTCDPHQAQPLAPLAPRYPVYFGPSATHRAAHARISRRSGGELGGKA